MALQGNNYPSKPRRSKTVTTPYNGGGSGVLGGGGGSPAPGSPGSPTLPIINDNRSTDSYNPSPSPRQSALSSTTPRGKSHAHHQRNFSGSRGGILGGGGAGIGGGGLSNQVPNRIQGVTWNKPGYQTYNTYSSKPQHHRQRQRNPTVPYQDTFTKTNYYSFKQKKGIKFTSLSGRRGSVLLADTLKREKIKDARDKGLAKLRHEYQKLEERLEELQAVNRKLQAEKQNVLQENTTFKEQIDDFKNYKDGLNQLLSSKTANANILWHENKPIFVADNTANENNYTIKAMNMNLEMKDYPRSEVKQQIEIDNEVDEDAKASPGDLPEDRMDASKLFENYLETIVRSSRIFYEEYYKTYLRQQEEKEKLDKEKKKNIRLQRTSSHALDKTQALNKHLEEVKKERDAAKILQKDSSRQIEKLKLKLRNMEQDFENEKKLINKQNNEAKKKFDEKLKSEDVKMRKSNAEKQDLIKQCEKIKTEREMVVNEKQKLEIHYGKVMKKLDQMQNHPIFSGVKGVDEVLTYGKIQREFYDDIFDEKANLHGQAFDYLRKIMKEKTKFNAKYCKQMTFKILFEIIHICYQKMNKRFKGIFKLIRGGLGIKDADNEEKSGLGTALDFVLKYQFEEIFNGIADDMINEVIEEIYENEFELIKSHDAQKILVYELHETSNPMERNRYLCAYIRKLCIVCWKMVIFNHKKTEKDRLTLYPTYFEEKNKALELSAEIHDKCTAHCEKKSDHILFYVYPIVIQEKYRDDIFAALLAADDGDIKEIDGDHDDSKGHDDESESHEFNEDEKEIMRQQLNRIQIKVVTRKGFYRSLSKDITARATDGKNTEEMGVVGQVVLLKSPPKIAVISQNFQSIHSQQHRVLFEDLETILEGEDDFDSDDEQDDDKQGDDNENKEDNPHEIDDGDMVEMKAYKILFDILVTCYMEIMRIKKEISAQRFTIKQLKYSMKYHVMLNFSYYFSKFSKNEEKDENKDDEDKEDLEEQRKIVLGLINKIYDKYCDIYSFLKAEEELVKKTRMYIMKCCESCFHFAAYGIKTKDEDEEEEEEEDDDDVIEYGLYPISFVRDGANCKVMQDLKERDMNNAIINFKTVKMGQSHCLCIYDDTLHEKESTSDLDEVKDIRNANICYFTWPAIITTNRNNEFIYGNLPKKCITKIWVQLNDGVYDTIYGINEEQNQDEEEN